MNLKKIIDTNILLDYTFEQIIGTLKREEDLELIIPLEVIRELDTFKIGMDTINVRARQAIRFIEEARHCGDITNGVLIEDGVTLIIKSPKEFPACDATASSDIRILSQALEGLQRDEDIELISSDIHARILANSLNIKSIDFNISTESKKHTSKISIEIDEEELNTFCRNYKTGLPTREEYGYNEFIEMRDPTGYTHYGIYDYKTKSIKRLPDSSEAWGFKPRVNGNGQQIPEQALLMSFLLDRNIEFLSVIGNSGCGKTFLTLACALEQTLGKNPIYDKIIVMRPLAAIDRDIGALPGNKIEKLTPWMGSVIDNLSILLSRKDPDEITGGIKKDEAHYMGSTDKINALLDSGKLELEALTFLRGRSIPNSFIIVEDAQNSSIKEATTIVTRVGEKSKLVFLGDISPAQIDNPRLNQFNNGLTHVRNKLSGVDPSVAHVDMNKVVRSRLASLGVQYL